MDNVIQFKSVFRQESQVRREQRRADGLNKLEQILAMPEDVQAHVMYATWRGKLPRHIKSRIPGRLRQSWRKIRKDEIAAEDAAWVKAISDKLGYAMDLPEFLELLPEDRIAEAREACGTNADLLLRTWQACDTVRRLTVNWADQSFVLDHPDLDTLRHPALRDFVCLMVGSEGSAVLREASRLRVQVKLHDGSIQWIPQERIYGFFCGHGTWGPESAATMRECYMTDADTGAALPGDPGTTMGDARDLIKRAGVRAPR